MTRLSILLAILCVRAACAEKKVPSPLDQYIEDATKRSANANGASAGSTWTPASPYADLGSDLRARQIDDLITVLVSERASAESKGTTKTSRQSELKSSVGAIAGKTPAAGALSN